MKVMKWITIVLMQLNLSVGVAASFSGGDGSAVVCYDDQGAITGVELFDYWEQKRVNNKPYEIDLGPADLPVKEKVELALKRIELFDKERVRTYKRIADELLKSVTNFDIDNMGPIPPLDDNSQIGPQEPCVKESFVVKRLKFSWTAKHHFRIRGDLYHHPKTSNDTKAGIILHEAIYYELSKNNENQDSSPVRLFNYLLSSRAFEEDYSMYSQTMQTLNFKTGLQTQSVTFPSGETKRLDISLGTLIIPVDYQDDRFELKLERGDSLGVNYENVVYSIQSKDEQLFKMNGEKYFFNKMRIRSSGIELNLTRKTEYNDKYIKASLLVPSRSRYNIVFSENGLMRSFKVDQGSYKSKLIEGRILPGSKIRNIEEQTLAEVEGVLKLGNRESLNFKGTAQIRGDKESSLKLYDSVTVESRGERFTTKTLTFQGQKVFAQRELKLQDPETGRGKRVNPTQFSADKFCIENGFQKAGQWGSGETPFKYRVYSYEKGRNVFSVKHISYLTCISNQKIDQIL